MTEPKDSRKYIEWRLHFLNEWLKDWERLPTEAPENIRFDLWDIITRAIKEKKKPAKRKLLQVNKV
ncbi:MAG: hypothetical protein WBB37_11950 [bacterium]